MPTRHLGLRAGLSDAQVVGLAAVVSLAAWWSPAVPLWWALVGVLVAAAVRRPTVVLLAAGLLSASLGARAWQGDRPVEAGEFRAAATLVTDPEPVAGAEVAEVRAEGHHFEVWAHGRAARRLGSRAAGQRVWIDGQVAPRPPGDDLEARRHVVGIVTPDEVESRPGAALWVAPVNRLRAVMLAGGRPLTDDQRSLYGGFILGDVDGQSPVVADDFRGSGLSHLLVVSGENVAFVVAVASPLLRRFGSIGRWAATLAVLMTFAAMTRFEPSVLRATAMAVIAVTAWSLGRRASGLRLVALAVTGLVLADPMLVGVAGFQLSVAASAGIVVAAAPLAEQLPLPGWLARPLAVTLAAQVAVSPILMAFYGGLPVATLPANLLAEPAAAVLMGWGTTVGALAGLVGGLPAAVLQLPAGALVWWVETVARWGAAAPLGQIGPVGLALGTATAWGAVRWGRAGRRGRAQTAWLMVLVVIGWPALTLLGARPPGQVELGRAGQAWTTSAGPGRAVVVLAPRAGLRDLLDGLRRAGIERVDLVVVPTGSRTALTVVADLARRVSVGSVWAPTTDIRPLAATARVRGLPPVVHPVAGEVRRLDDLRVAVRAVGPRLQVTVSRSPGVGSASAAVARAPPIRRHPSGRGDGHLEPHA
jgi:competence protein ComEC